MKKSPSIIIIVSIAIIVIVLVVLFLGPSFLQPTEARKISIEDVSLN